MRIPYVSSSLSAVACLVALTMFPLGPALAGAEKSPQLSQAVTRDKDNATPSPKPGNCSASSKDGKQTCQTNCKEGQVANCTDGDPPTCSCS